jgi:hypothetical protein
MVTLFELVVSHAPTSSGSAGVESRSSHRLEIKRIENRIPAIAAARGVRKRP